MELQVGFKQEVLTVIGDEARDEKLYAVRKLVLSPVRVPSGQLKHKA